MANSTVEYWEVDGVSLQTYAFDITTIGGDRLAPPPLVGDDIVLPGTAGEYWVPKEIGARTITLGMWVIGADEDGFAPTGSNAAQFDTNFRKLRNLLWNPYRQVTLTKRFYVDGELKTASAQAQFVSGLNPTMNGRARAVFSVDLRLTDPFFYGPEVVTNLTTGSQTVEVEGDARTNNIQLTINGSRVNPKVRNSLLDVDVEYFGSLSSGDSVEIDVKAYTAVVDPATGANFNGIGAIRHSGNNSWLLLEPGDNTIVLSSDSGTGAVVMTHRAAWL